VYKGEGVGVEEEFGEKKYRSWQRGGGEEGRERL